MSVLVVVLLLSAVACVVIGHVHDRRFRRLHTHGTRSPATVIGWSRGTRGEGVTYVLRFRFEVHHSGGFDELTGERVFSDAHPNAYTVGDQVVVVYPAGRPERVDVAGRHRYSTVPGALMMAGFLVVMAVVTAALG